MNLAVSLRDLKIGGRSVLPAGEGTTVSPQAHSGRPPEVVYSRGPVTERYLLLADAVEQIFTLGSDLEALRVEGDLTVDLGLGTSLTPVLKRSEGGGPVREWVEFQGPEGRPLLTIGAALAVEAEGRTRTLRYELVEGGLVMRLDASFLKEARFPLTIDPLIGSFLSFSSTYRDRVAGVAYSPAADVFLAVTEYGWNPDQGDILCTAVDASGNYWSAFVTNQYTDDSRAPRVARSSGNQFLVVWQERSGATGWSIRGRFVTIAGLTPTLSAPTFTIATGNDDINPDVGFSAGAGVYTVCWERVVSASNHDIQAVTVTTAGVVGTPFALDTASSFEETPSITSAMPGILGVAWIRRSAPGAQGDVQACSVDASAGSATAPVAISAVPSDEETPRLGGDFTGSGTTYLAWVRRAAGGDGDIWGQRITFGAGGPAAGSAFSVEAGGANSFHPSCDAGTRSGIQRVAFAWSRNPTVPPTQLGSDLYGAVYDASVDPPTLVEALSVDTSTSGSTHSAVAVNPSLMNALVVWNEESSPGSIQFYGRRVALTAVPAIGVNASSYSFTTSAAGGSSAYGNLTVSNLSGGTLIYTATEPASWLTLSSGGASLA
ncbi:MAG TPA: hypothetical protein VJB14_03280, partial [Planctomycetota bacterium]|nr:hypothetical protein [Planctomycetota bacterium]